MQLEMSISTEQWMDLMSYVVDNLDNVDSPLRPQTGFRKRLTYFFGRDIAAYIKRFYPTSRLMRNLCSQSLVI